MKNETRKLFDKYTDRIAELNGVPDATKKFTVEPSVAQTLEQRIAEKADFLGEVSTIPVTELKGQVISVGVNRRIASRTKTATPNNPRVTKNIADMTGREYECKKTDFDTNITYEQMDRWAGFGDQFQTMMRNLTTEQIAADRLVIGFHGTSAADNSDAAAHPMLEDMNIGWLQKLRTEAPARVMPVGLKVGTAAGADYPSIDALVFDMVHSLLDPWHRSNSAINAITGAELVTDKFMTMLKDKDGQAPTERSAMQTLLLNQTIGGKIGKIVPFFPERSILVTFPKNLIIHPQIGSLRRMVKDNPEYDRVDDFLSDNEAYAIGTLGAACLVDGILLWNPAANAGVGAWE